MRQISIKNQEVAHLLDEVTRLTGQGKTQAIAQALLLYRASLLADRDTSTVIASIRDNVHPYVMPQHRGKAPTKGEIETDLGMP